MKNFANVVSLALAAAVAGACNLAEASGFQLIEQNASGLGNAYAGQAAAAENASTIFFNPAGMTLLPGRQVSGAVHLIGPSIKFSDNGNSRSPAGVPAPAGGDNGGNAGDWIPTGNAYVSWQFTPRLWAGLGFSVPFGLETDYDAAFIGRFQSRKAELQTYDFNPSLAYRINDALSIGMGLSYQRAKVTLDRSFFAGVALPEHVDLDDNSWGWNVGALFTLGPRTRIGLSYRSTVDYTLSGTAAVTGVGAASAQAKIRMPDTLSWAVSHAVNDKWRLLGDVTYTHWSTVKNVPLVLTSAGLGAFPSGTTADVLDFQFRDTYRVGLGATYAWNEQFMLKLGTAYDKSPVPDALHRTAFLPDSDRWWLAVGGKYRVSKAGTMDFGYAHLFIVNGDTLRNKGIGTAGAEGILSGTYKSNVNILSVQYSHSF